MKKRVTTVVLAACIAASSLMGCSGSGGTGETEGIQETKESGIESTAQSLETEQTQANKDDKVTIRFAWWGSQNRADKTNQAVELFMEKNPDIVVETSFFPFDSYYENLSIAASAGNMPDVWQGFVGGNNDLMEAKLVEPLDEYIDKGLINVSDISEGLRESAKVDGKTYGVSLGCNVKCLIVDPEAYEKAGLTVPEVAYKSWDALGEDLQKLKDSGLQYGGDDMFERGFTFEYFCRQNGEHLFSDTQATTIAFSKSTYVDYYNYKLDWINKGLIPPYDVTKESSGPEDSQIARGTSAVRNCYSSQYAQIANAAGKKLQLILLPGPGTEKGTDIRPGMHVCMASGSKNKEASAKLIDFLVNDVDCNKILNAERGIPASSVVRDAISTGFDENQKIMAEAVDLAEAHSSISEPVPMGDTSEISSSNSGLMEDLEQLMIYGEITPEDAYKQLYDQFGPK